MAKKQPKPKGSTRKGQEKGPNLSTHPLVSRFLGDSPATGERVALMGYIGPSEKPNHVRLYLGLDFRAFHELHKNGIIETGQADPANPNGPTIVVISAKASHVLVKLPFPGSETTFLRGPIVAKHGAGAASAAGPEALPECDLGTNVGTANELKATLDKRGVELDQEDDLCELGTNVRA